MGVGQFKSGQQTSLNVYMARHCTELELFDLNVTQILIHLHKIALEMGKSTVHFMKL